MLIKSVQERATGVSVQMGEFQCMTLVMSRQRFRMEGPASAENAAGGNGLSLEGDWGMVAEEKSGRLESELLQTAR